MRYPGIGRPASGLGGDADSIGSTGNRVSQGFGRVKVLRSRRAESVDGI
jgi:hypothetical protein